jgi:hypothetical protein
MTEEKQQNSRPRYAAVWSGCMAWPARSWPRRKAEATGVRIEGFTASELADVESALTWIAQNKESPGAEPAA